MLLVLAVELGALALFGDKQRYVCYLCSHVSLNSGDMLGDLDGSVM